MTEGFHHTEYGLDYLWLTSAHDVTLSRRAARAVRWIRLSCGSAWAPGPFPEHCDPLAARLLLPDPEVDALTRAEADCIMAGAVRLLFVLPAHTGLTAETGPASGLARAVVWVILPAPPGDVVSAPGGSHRGGRPLLVDHEGDRERESTMRGPMMSGSDNRSCRDAGSRSDAERLGDGGSFRYSGQELPQMARAVHWKSYIAELVRPHLGPSVLEVGAGIGSNIPYLRHPPVREWTAVEPDAAQAAQIRDPGVRVVAGTIAAIGATERFDAILYLDVLEHLADDAAELRRAATHLVPGGRLIVLAPAHRWLTSPMDAAVGHYRRYSAAGCVRSRRWAAGSRCWITSMRSAALPRSPIAWCCAAHRSAPVRSGCGTAGSCRCRAGWTDGSASASARACWRCGVRWGRSRAGSIDARRSRRWASWVLD
jgi:SAM-dependent methyltransferase